VKTLDTGSTINHVNVRNSKGQFTTLRRAANPAQHDRRPPAPLFIESIDWNDANNELDRRIDGFYFDHKVWEANNLGGQQDDQALWRANRRGRREVRSFTTWRKLIDS